MMFQAYALRGSRDDMRELVLLGKITMTLAGCAIARIAELAGQVARDAAGASSRPPRDRKRR